MKRKSTKIEKTRRKIVGRWEAISDDIVQLDERLHALQYGLGRFSKKLSELEKAVNDPRVPPVFSQQVEAVEKKLATIDTHRKELHQRLNDILPEPGVAGGKLANLSKRVNMLESQLAPRPIEGVTWDCRNTVNGTPETIEEYVARWQQHSGTLTLLSHGRVVGINHPEQFTRKQAIELLGKYNAYQGMYPSMSDPEMRKMNGETIDKLREEIIGRMTTAVEFKKPVGPKNQYCPTCGWEYEADGRCSNCTKGMP